MAFWKQLILSVAVLVAGLFLWVMFVPGAAGVLSRLGVPQGVVAAAAPSSVSRSTRKCRSACGSSWVSE